MITLKVKDYTDERMQPWNELKLTVRPNPTLPDLTEQQIEFVHGYMEKYRLNLNRFMGEVSCRVEVTFQQMRLEYLVIRRLAPLKERV